MSVLSAQVAAAISRYKHAVLRVPFSLFFKEIFDVREGDICSSPTLEESRKCIVIVEYYSWL